MYKKDSIKRISLLFPEAYIIVLLRNPLDRAFSQYNYRMEYDRYTETFDEMAKKENQRIKFNESNRLEYGCLDRSLYFSQLKNIYKFFPANNIKIILFEDFIINQNTICNNICDWLRIKKFKFKSVFSNSGGKSRSVIFAKFLYHSDYKNFRDFFNLLLPKNILSIMYKFLIFLNKKTYKINEKPKLTEFQKNKYMNFFYKDIEKLKKLTGLDFEVWIKK